MGRMGGGILAKSLEEMKTKEVGDVMLGSSFVSGLIFLFTELRKTLKNVCL